MAILSKFARQLAKRVKKKGPPKTNAQKIDAMTSKLKKLEGQKTRRKEAAERNKREQEQKLAREKAFAKYQKQKKKPSIKELVQKESLKIIKQGEKKKKIISKTGNRIYELEKKARAGKKLTSNQILQLSKLGKIDDQAIKFDSPFQKGKSPDKYKGTETDGFKRLRKLLGIKKFREIYGK